MKTIFTIMMLALLLGGCATGKLKKEYASWPLKPYPVSAQNS